VGVLVIEGGVSLLAPSDAGCAAGSLLGGTFARLWVDDGVRVYFPEFVSLVAPLEWLAVFVGNGVGMVVGFCDGVQVIRELGGALVEGSFGEGTPDGVSLVEIVDN